MKERFLKKLIWFVNIFFFIGVIYMGNRVFSAVGKGSQSPALIPVSDSIEEYRSQPIFQRKKLTESDLERVFSRSFLATIGRGSSSPFGQKRTSFSSSAAPNEAPQKLPVKNSTKQKRTVSKKSVGKNQKSKLIIPLSKRIRLVAIFHSNDVHHSSVVIENLRKGNRQELYWNGETLKEVDVKIVRIKKDSVEFLYTSRLVSLRLEKSKQNEKTAAKKPFDKNKKSATITRNQSIDPLHHYIVPRKEVIEVVSKPLEFLRGIRYRLVEKDGQVQGFRITGIDPKSVAARYGIKNNDIISSMNGKAIDNQFSPFNMVSELTNSNMIHLKVKRNNQEINLSYAVR